MSSLSTYLDDDELESLSISQLFTKALKSASCSLDLPFQDESTQRLLQSSLAALILAQSLLSARGVFSTNESLDDISTKGLAFMFVPFTLAEVVNRVKTSGVDERLERVRQAEKHYTSFIELVDTYGAVSDADKKALHRAGGTDPAKRREEKIRIFKWERDLKKQIQDLAHKLLPKTPLPTNHYGLILSLLTTTLSEDSEASSGDTFLSSSDTLSIIRFYTLSLLSLMYSEAISQLESLTQEMEILRMVPSGDDRRIREVDDEREKQRTGDDGGDNEWRLDTVRIGGPDGKGELLDKSGKPLRPFTILPSSLTSKTRSEHLTQVFQSGHRLPTMTIDEYLQNEFDSGRVITGGGKASEEALTTKEILELESEMDGTLEGDEKFEEKRQQDEKWALFTEEHRKGEGNTINRG